jgi:phage shock protein A
LKVTVSELEQVRADVECAELTISQLDAELDSVRAERDTYRAQASVTS